MFMAEEEESDIRYSRREFVAVGVSAGVGALLLPASDAAAAGETDPASTWVVARVDGQPAQYSLKASLLPSGRPLNVSLSSRAPFTRFDGQPQTQFAPGETFVAEGTAPLDEGATSLEALRLVRAVIGRAEDARR
jgi:hypothetical protein